MNTDTQEGNPARQRRDIEDMAKGREFQIPAWYENLGLADRVERRSRELGKSPSRRPVSQTAGQSHYRQW